MFTDYKTFATNFVEIYVFALVNWPRLILNTLILFLLTISKTHICIAHKNSFWLLVYTKLAINSPHITITSCTHIDGRVPMLTSVKKWQFWHEQTKSAERTNDHVSVTNCIWYTLLYLNCIFWYFGELMNYCIRIW